MQGLIDFFTNLFAKLFKSSPQPPPAPLPITPKPAPNIPSLPPISGTRVLGIDVSHHEPAVDWPKAKAAGVLWMYTKASEGAHFIDPSIKEHVTSASKAGVYTGAYHFYRADIDGTKQANLFLDVVKNIKVDLPYILDWESASPMGESREVQIAGAQHFLDTVEKASGKIPMIYGGEAFIRDLRLPSSFNRYPLIVAHYGTPIEKVKCPPPWSKMWGWQYAEDAKIAGMAAGHSVDANLFLGTLDELKKFIG